MEATRSKPNKNEVLAKAIYNVKESLNLPQQIIGDIIGASSSAISRLKSSSSIFDDKKKAENAAYFLRACRSLKAIVGSDSNMRLWLNAYNKDLKGVPIKRMVTIEGLVDVCRYLDAMRGKV